MSPSYTCLTKNTDHEKWNVHGVNLGGLFVLEPWITPSIFYQFINVKDSDKIGMDMYSFCKALGPVEGKRQLNAHFSLWVNETDLAKLSQSGITHVRLPLGDWMFRPYGPYVGCTDGSLAYFEKVLNWCHKYDLRVLLDMHGVIDSQNGLDNSGHSQNVEYIVNPPQYVYDSILTFRHWPIRAGNWMGHYDIASKNYTSWKPENVAFTKQILFQLVDTYKRHPAVWGLEPLNEPWEYTPQDKLKDFYYEVYEYMHQHAPHWKFIYHNSFRENIWSDFLLNCSNVALDWHIYQAWNIERYGDQFLLEADNYGNYIDMFKRNGVQIVVGEFSMATDNCAMWLNGFQDNLEGFPITDCKYAPCPFPYIDVKDLQRVNPILSPFGTGFSTPRMGTCPYEGQLVIADAELGFLHDLTYRKLRSFEHAQGWFFWNFKTEMKKEIGWNFQEGYKHNLFQGTVLQPYGQFRFMDYLGLLGFVLLAQFIIVYGGLQCYRRFFKSPVRKYQYVRVEMPATESAPLHMHKKYASAGNVLDRTGYMSV